MVEVPKGVFQSRFNEKARAELQAHPGAFRGCLPREESETGPGREFLGDENPQALPGGILPNFDSGSDSG
jgi:hypothetical protein